VYGVVVVLLKGSGWQKFINSFSRLTVTIPSTWDRLQISQVLSEDEVAAINVETQMAVRLN
jgi:hypothetical protein